MVHELLLAVDDEGVVETETGVEDGVAGRFQRHDDRERRRRDDVGVAERLGRFDVAVGRVLVADRIGELADLLAAHLVRPFAGEGPADVVAVERHVISLGPSGQHVSGVTRIAVTLPKGQSSGANR